LQLAQPNAHFKILRVVVSVLPASINGGVKGGHQPNAAPNAGDNVEQCQSVKLFIGKAGNRSYQVVFAAGN
jgi:hypothetical protein